MAASMKEVVADFIAGTDDCAAKTVATEINRKNAKFLDFIECLGPALTGSGADNVGRGRATKLIGDVLALLPLSFLSDDQAQVVSAFLLAKLADHHSVQPAALHSFSQLTNRCSPLPEGLASQICQAIFREIQNQSLSHADRRCNYLIFQNLLASSGKELERMGGDFVIGFIQQMDAEKDPRNLLLVFGCAQYIISNIPLGPFTEEMFEVLGCYFPIEFTPPPNNPHGITKEELILTLRKCFSATSDFAPFCIPLLLEKITSDLQSARIDALETLTDCALTYGRKGLTEYFDSITSSLKREILMDVNAELVETSQLALTAVYKAMSPATGVKSTQDDSLRTSMVEMYQDINKFLEGSNPKKSCLAFSVCRAIAVSSTTAFCTMIPLALPAVIKACTESPQDSDKILYLQEVNRMLEVMTTLQLTKEEKDELRLSAPLCTLFEGLMESKGFSGNVGVEMIKGVVFLMTVKDLLSTQQSSAFMKSLVQIGSLTDDKSLRKELLISLQKCLEANSYLLEETINSLKEGLSKEVDSSWSFDCLPYTATNKESFEKTSNILLDVIFKPLDSDVQWKGLEGVHSLKRLIENQRLDSSATDNLVPFVLLPLLKVSLTLWSQWDKDTSDKCKEYLAAVRDTFSIISSKTSLRNQLTSFWDMLCTLMLDGKKVLIYDAELTGLKPLLATSPWQQTRLVAVLEGFLAGAPMQVLTENLERTFEAVFALARDSSDEFTHLSACRCSAIILNKSPLGSQIHWFLEPIALDLQKVLTAPDNEASQMRCLHVWAWLTKALECRGHSAAGIFISKLVSMLGDKLLGREAACGLGLMFEDLPTTLSIPLHANISPMYKQRVFSLNLKNMLEDYAQAKTTKDVAQNYLLAFSLITSNLHQQILKPHLEKLVPLLLVSLDGLSGTFQQTTLSTLMNAVLHTPDAITTSVDALIPRLLSIARVDPKMTVRIAALLCLEKVAGLPIHCISPYQKRVVKELAGALDDKKRLVRMQAVETRNAWIMTEDNKT